MTPELVIFDCDGVLVDSETVTNRILSEELTERGLPLTVEQVAQSYVGGTLADVARRVSEAGADLPDDWVERFYERMYATLAEGTGLIEGVEAVLDQLDAAGIPYAVGSNGSMRKMEITLGQHPQVYTRLKPNLFSAHVHGVAKPDPGLFLLAVEKFAVPPERCAVIDDSPNGCTAGVRAGIPTYGFAEHDDGARLAEIGATVFHRMAALPGLLGL